MKEYCIKVKRREFNYYIDYMESYFEKLANHYNYHIVKNPKQAEFSCITFIDEPRMGQNDSKWMIFTSKTFNQITYQQLLKLSELIAECFKTESIIEEKEKTALFGSIEDHSFRYGTPHCWYFSKIHSAFDESPFLTDGETVIRIDSQT